MKSLTTDISVAQLVTPGRTARKFGRQALKAAEDGAAPRVFRRLRGRWLRWLKPRKRR